MVGHVFTTSIQEAEAGGPLWVWDHSGLHSELQSTQGYIVNPVSRKRDGWTRLRSGSTVEAWGYSSILQRRKKKGMNPHAYDLGSWETETPFLARPPECYNENYVKTSLRQSTSQGTQASHLIAWKLPYGGNLQAHGYGFKISLRRF